MEEVREGVCESALFYLCISCLLKGRLFIHLASIFTLTFDAAQSHKSLTEGQTDAGACII